MKLQAICLLLCLFSFNSSNAQTDPEFKKGFILHLELQNGMQTNFKSGNDLFVGGIHLAPQWTLAPSVMRAGLRAGLFYNEQKIQTVLGPTISIKLKSFNASVFGTSGNINLSIDHLWGSNKQRLLGGGINLDLLNKIVLGPQLHRDYNRNNWWIQFKAGYRISRLKKTKEPFNN